MGFLNEGAPDDRATPSRKSQSDLPKRDLRAFHVNHAQDSIVFVIDNWHDHLGFCGPESREKKGSCARRGPSQPRRYSRALALSPGLERETRARWFILLVAASMQNRLRLIL